MRPGMEQWIWWAEPGGRWKMAPWEAGEEEWWPVLGLTVVIRNWPEWTNQVSVFRRW